MILIFIVGNIHSIVLSKLLILNKAFRLKKDQLPLWIVRLCNSDQIKCSFNFMTPACQAHLRREIRQLFYGRQDSQFCIFYPRKPCQLWYLLIEHVLHLGIYVQSICWAKSGFIYDSFCHNTTLFFIIVYYVQHNHLPQIEVPTPTPLQICIWLPIQEGEGNKTLQNCFKAERVIQT